MAGKVKRVSSVAQPVSVPKVSSPPPAAPSYSGKRALHALSVGFCPPVTVMLDGLRVGGTIRTRFVLIHHILCGNEPLKLINPELWPSCRQNPTK